jgi:hypothetical protein
MNTSQHSKPRPVLIALSILATLQAFFLAAEAGDIVGEKLRLVLLAALAAINVGVGFYLTGQVTPFGNVVAYQPNPDQPEIIRAGGAAGVADNQRIRTERTVEDLLTADR